MAITKKYKKKILCLESDYEDKMTNDWTVQGVLQQLKNFEIDSIYRRFSTKEELSFLLKKLKSASYANYSIIYLTCHGSPGYIHVNEEEISLAELAQMSNGAFKNKIIHFGSCETVKSEKRVEAFLTESKALMISGDLKQIDFLESVAMDLLYFNAAQDYKSSKYLKKFIENNYVGLKDKTGFKIYD